MSNGISINSLANKGSPDIQYSKHYKLSNRMNIVHPQHLKLVYLIGTVSLYLQVHWMSFGQELVWRRD